LDGPSSTAARTFQFGQDIESINIEKAVD